MREKIEPHKRHKYLQFITAGILNMTETETCDAGKGTVFFQKVIRKEWIHQFNL